MTEKTTFDLNKNVHPAVVIISLLLLVGLILTSVPWFGYRNSRKAKDSTLKGNLTTLREAAEKFKIDTGVYPQKLEDLSTSQAPTYVEAEKYKGTYLNNQGGIKGGVIPRNPYVPSTDSDAGHHRSYSATSASVTISFPTPPGTDANGEPYSGY